MLLFSEMDFFFNFAYWYFAELCAQIAYRGTYFSKSEFVQNNVDSVNQCCGSVSRRTRILLDRTRFGSPGNEGYKIPVFSTLLM
jgi:hypothetical protein